MELSAFWESFTGIGLTKTKMNSGQMARPHDARIDHGQSCGVPGFLVQHKAGGNDISRQSVEFQVDNRGLGRAPPEFLTQLYKARFTGREWHLFVLRADLELNGSLVFGSVSKCEIPFGTRLWKPENAV